MEKIHARALEALQPFVHLAATSTSPTPRFIANLITNATSSPNTFFFAELLETPAVQALGSLDTPDEYRAYLSLLEIFAWGTWQEYQGEWMHS
jgi:COP9 signalosome complex subunit 7